MSGILGKMRALGLGHIHNLLDRAIDAKSIPVVEQYLRDLRKADEELADTLAVAQGRLTQRNNEVTATQTAMKTTEGNIMLILRDNDTSNDHIAEEFEARLIAMEEQLTARQQMVVTQQELVAGLTEAKQKMGDKVTEMENNLSRLRGLVEAAEAQEQAAEALQSAGRAAGRASGISLDNVEQRIQDRSTVSNARFKRALGSVADTADVGVVAAQAKERIAARRAAINESK